MASDRPSRPPSSQRRDGVDALLRDVAQAPAVDVGELPPPLPESLGHYRIAEKLARGGMGEVYKAYDTSLQRFVALKILPGELARDEAQVRRFLQEARAASALNHPNIVTIYEIQAHHLERSDGAAHCIAMELVDGLTLREWVEREKPPLGDLLDLFTQIAHGLAKAHEAGIVHRDLKPENVMVTRDGFAKILDFGLAKLETAVFEVSDKDTTAQGVHRLTRSGAMVGTVGYMSPEQVRGQPVDPRSDVFAFGSILFEALTGRRAFPGDSAVDILHAILHAEVPALAELNPTVPPELERIVAQCLAKDPGQRPPTARQLAVALRALQQHPEAPAPRRLRSHRRRRGLVIAGLLALALATTLFSLLLGEQRGTAPPGSAAPEPRRSERLTYSGRASTAAVSPDGKVVVHAVTTGGRSSLWVRQVATSSSLQIVPPAEATYCGVVVSPDGNYAYYVLQRGLEGGKRLFRVPILGGAPRLILSEVDSPIAFSPGGKRLAFARCTSIPRRCALFVAGADGSAPRPLAAPAFSEPPGHPTWSPDGKRLAFVTRAPASQALIISELALSGGDTRPLSPASFTDVSGLAWHPDGRSLLVAGTQGANHQSQLYGIAYPSGELRRITNDVNSYSGVSITGDRRALVSTQVSEVNNLWVLPLSGPARRLTRDVGRLHSFATGRDARIVYSALESGTWDLWVLEADRPPRRLTTDTGGNFEPALSPDGRTVAFVSDRGGASAIWRIDLQGSGARQLTRGGRDRSPAFTPDGKWIVYTAAARNRRELWRVPAEGGEVAPLTKAHTAVGAVSPDGARLATGFWDEHPDSPWKIAILQAAGGTKERAFELPPTARPIVEWTPDGQGLSYVDDRGGASSIWVQPLDGPPRKLVELDSDVVFQHRWSSKGELVVIRGMRASDIVILRGF